jgi:hypothetical protein
MVSPVERGEAEPALEVTVTVTVPLPVPEAGATLAHGALLEAVQEQFGPLAITVMGPAPPAEPKGLPLPEASTVTLQGIPSWRTWNDCPPMVKLPVRETVVEFAETEYINVPEPIPDPPAVTLSQLGPNTVL